MAILVLADHDGGVIKQPTRSALAAAARIGALAGGEVHLLVAGHGSGEAARAAARLPGVAKVLHADGASLAHALAEPMAALLARLAPGYTHLLSAATAQGKNVMPRLAALIDVQPISDIAAVVAPDTFVRPIYAGNALATVRSSDPVKVLTVRAASFDPVPAEGGAAAIEALPVPEDPGLSRFIGQELTASARPELTSARVVVSGGRGMGSAENFKLIEAVADKLGAAVGASRAAVDAGFVPNDYQVGQTGKIVAPELYIAVGISGAIQHLAGMKDSKVIVAINKDEEAPIFQVADYGLVGDLFQVLPELAAELEKTA
ncbi:FAD-binding protein [Elioraea tepida]|jgi:electron transfer flavoprotein alpha subunit|uniref:Electron transfer flavoprotein subunit alpha n=1 Tax=Elioraea tepida TaxID=2843330 RepID=A0A975YIC8_9PROT|nr:FAD-binding protein [Elioraea tepida]QXM23439.1 FAD-binding protein [Elioraea tepida]